MKEMSFRVFVTDTLRIIGENTARFAGGGYGQQRWYDIITKKPDNRTGDEIAADIIRKITGGVRNESL